MIEVKWTNNALEELDDIANYISKDSPKFADILVKQIYEMISHLEQFPGLEGLYQNKMILILGKSYIRTIELFIWSKILT